MQTEKSQPEGKWIMPETRFTEFPALSGDPRIGISQSASETDDCLFIYLLLNKLVLFPWICLQLRSMAPNSERHSEFFVKAR